MLATFPAIQQILNTCISDLVNLAIIDALGNTTRMIKSCFARKAAF